MKLKKGISTRMNRENGKSNDTNLKEENTRETGCGSWTFPFFFISSLLQLIVYLNKLYQDCSAVFTYYRGRDINYCIISISCFLVPALIYTFYLIFDHLNQKQNIKVSVVVTNIIYGALLIPWQIKSILEVLDFSAQRIYKRRALTKDETKDHNFIEHQAKVLEFFEDFFAGFIQLILQIYIIILSLDDSSFNSKILLSEVISSGLIILSMMLAVRRKDDGCLTTFLSFTGWTLIAASRSLTLALAATKIHGGIIAFCLLHASIITIWLVPICWKSYSETELSYHRKFSTTLLIFFIFGLPSLIYWPILFQLKKNKRPFIFMIILSLENIGLLCIWYFLTENKQWNVYNTYFITVTVGGFILGFVFILLYMYIKPKYTDQVVYHDMKVENASSFGMYFEFCDATFKLPVSQWIDSNLQQIRQS